MTQEIDENAIVKKEKRYLKALYFVMFLAFGSISPFAMIFYKRVLTNPDGSPAIHLIGIVVSSVPIVGFFANLFVGVLADKFGISRKLITILSFFGAFIALIVGLCGTQSIMALAIEQKFILMLLAVLAFNFVTASLNPLVDSETLTFLNKHSDRKKFGSFIFLLTFVWAFSVFFIVRTEFAVCF
jgi:MFS family permease